MDTTTEYELNNFVSKMILSRVNMERAAEVSLKSIQSLSLVANLASSFSLEVTRKRSCIHAVFMGNSFALTFINFFNDISKLINLQMC